METSETDLYDIRAMSRLTGVTSANLRAWERRYGLVQPRRTSSNRRLYSQEDFAKLERVKKLADSGESLSVIAALEESEMIRRIEQLESHSQRGTAAAQGPGRRIKAAVAGIEVREALASHSHLFEMEGFDLDFHWNSLDELEANPPGPGYDILIVSFPTLFSYTLERLRPVLAASGGARCMVFYRFAASRTIANILVPGSGIIPIKGPVDFQKLVIANRELLRIGAVSEGADEIRGPRFNPEQLAKFARLSTTIECECPKHLAELASSLQAFAEYSRTCASRNPDDEAMHVYLHQVSCRARNIIEEALEKLMWFEGIDLQD